jgi:homoserine kinase type II
MTDSMGGLMDRTGQELPLAELAALWPLGGWASVGLVPAGKNEHLRVTAADGTYYLRRSYRSKPREELAGQLQLMRLLRDRGFPAPELIPACTGKDYTELSGRLWIATRGVEGTAFDDGSAAHVRALGRTLARYHRIVAGLPAKVAEPAVLTELRTRGESEEDPQLRARTMHVVERLTRLLPDLPRVIVHGGARRGSLVFAGDEVVGVLDFDSSHPDVRVLDLAVAVHDVGKVYTSLGEADHKVALDLGRVTELLAAYGQDLRPTAAEVEALPLLLEAKRLKRGLGRRSRARDGETLSDNDHAKIRLEEYRLAWLDEHHDALAAALRNALAVSPQGTTASA